MLYILFVLYALYAPAAIAAAREGVFSHCERSVIVSYGVSYPISHCAHYLWLFLASRASADHFILCDFFTRSEPGFVFLGGFILADVNTAIVSRVIAAGYFYRLNDLLFDYERNKSSPSDYRLVCGDHDSGRFFEPLVRGAYRGTIRLALGVCICQWVVDSLAMLVEVYKS